MPVEIVDNFKWLFTVAGGYLVADAIGSIAFDNRKLSEQSKIYLTGRLVRGAVGVWLITVGIRGGVK